MGGAESSHTLITWLVPPAPPWSYLGPYQEFLVQVRYGWKGLLMNNKKHSCHLCPLRKFQGFSKLCSRNLGWRPSMYFLLYHSISVLHKAPRLLYERIGHMISLPPKTHPWLSIAFGIKSQILNISTGLDDLPLCASQAFSYDSQPTTAPSPTLLSTSGSLPRLLPLPGECFSTLLLDFLFSTQHRYLFLRKPLWPSRPGERPCDTVSLSTIPVISVISCYFPTTP